jgi:hypothetical protein
MLALAAAAHGGADPTPVLVVLGALAAAAFWRTALKFAIALVIIVMIILFIHVAHDETAFFEGLRQVAG